MDRKLTDICRIQYGYAFDSAKFTSGEGVPLVRIRDVVRGYSETFTTEECSEDYIVNDGDMLIGMDGEFNIAHWKGGRAYLNQRVCKLIPGNEADGLYLYYFMPKALKAIEDKTPFVTVKHLSAKELNKVVVPLPDMREQRRIGTSLQKIDELIALRKEQLAKLDELVKVRFVEIFGDQESNPLGWKRCTIGECCTLKSGTSLPADVENEGGPIPYVKVGDMNYPGNERYITTSSRYVSELTAGKGIFEIGSILFPKRGGAIGTNKKRMTKLPVCADLNVMGVSSNGDLLPEYLLAYFDLIDLGPLADGSSVPQINNKNIAPLVICLPPMELQKKFAAFVKQTDKTKLTIQASLDKLEVMKKALMQEYFG